MPKHRAVIVNLREYEDKNPQISHADVMRRCFEPALKAVLRDFGLHMMFAQFDDIQTGKTFYQISISDESFPVKEKTRQEAERHLNG
jgi:hypothetical protein